jgi:hypothetical protein
MSDRSTDAGHPPKRPPSRPADGGTSDLPAGLSAPARRALAGAGIFGLADLSARTETEVLRLHGMGPKAMGLLRAALAARGLTFADGSR